MNTPIANAIEDTFRVLNRPVDLAELYAQLEFVWYSPLQESYEILMRYVNNGGQLNERDWEIFKNDAMESYGSLDCFPLSDYKDSLGVICLLYIVRDICTCGNYAIPLSSQTYCVIPANQSTKRDLMLAHGFTGYFHINKVAFFELMPVQYRIIHENKNEPVDLIHPDFKPPPFGP